jgi:hypothetical protein
MFSNAETGAHDEDRRSNGWIANQYDTECPAGTICGVG